MANRQPLTLKMRAITLLSQREHSPAELRRKLQRIQAEIAEKARQAADDKALGPLDDEAAGERAAAEIDTLIAWLQAQGYLSEARFVESRIHARASRFGSLRIRQELAQHGLSLGGDVKERLQASEFERALAVWQRKYGGRPPAFAGDEPVDWEQVRAEQARQTRFLTARGFAPDVVRRVLRAASFGQASEL